MVGFLLLDRLWLWGVDRVREAGKSETSKVQSAHLFLDPCFAGRQSSREKQDASGAQVLAIPAVNAFSATL